MLCGSIVLSPIWGPVGSQHCWYLKLPPQCVLVCLCSSIIVRAGRTTEAYNAGSPSHGRGLPCTLTMQCTSVKDGQRLESMALSSAVVDEGVYEEDAGDDGGGDGGRGERGDGRAVHPQ